MLAPSISARNSNGCGWIETCRRTRETGRPSGSRCARRSSGPIPNCARRDVDLGILQQAIFTDRRLAIRYRPGYDGRLRFYTLDPYGLVDKAGVWYLVADHRREAKLFRIDRMSSARATDEPVQRRAGVELADLWDVLRRRID